MRPGDQLLKSIDTPLLSDRKLAKPGACVVDFMEARWCDGNGTLLRPDSSARRAYPRMIATFSWLFLAFVLSRVAAGSLLATTTLWGYTGALDWRAKRATVA